MHTWDTSTTYLQSRVSTDLSPPFFILGDTFATSLFKRLLQGCLQGCYKVVYKVVTRLLQGCCKVVARLLCVCSGLRRGPPGRREEEKERERKSRRLDSKLLDH